MLRLQVPAHEVAAVYADPVVHLNPGRCVVTICPIALAVGCAKCPAVKMCPLKSVLGDYKEPPPPAEKKKSK